MSTTTGPYRVKPKHASVMAQEEARARDAQIITVSCLLCPEWGYTGPAGEAREIAADHRRTEHPKAAAEARARRAKQRQAQTTLAGAKPRARRSPSTAPRARRDPKPASAARRPRAAARARVRPLPEGGAPGPAELAALAVVDAARLVDEGVGSDEAISQLGASIVELDRIVRSR